MWSRGIATAPGGGLGTLPQETEQFSLSQNDCGINTGMQPPVEDLMGITAPFTGGAWAAPPFFKGRGCSPLDRHWFRSNKIIRRRKHRRAQDGGGESRVLRYIMSQHSRFNHDNHNSYSFDGNTGHFASRENLSRDAVQWGQKTWHLRKYGIVGNPNRD